MLDKNPLRKKLQQQRSKLSHRTQKQRGQQLLRLLCQIADIQAAQRIACYWPSQGEISPVLFMQYCQQHGKQIYLPKILPQAKMQFLHYTSTTGLIRKRFGIKQPATRQQLAVKHMDVVLLPLVGFDKQGNRLGMGGGYYDRALAFLQKQRWRKKPVLLGIAHDFQQLASLPIEVWDIALDGVVTNGKIIRLTTRR